MKLYTLKEIIQQATRKFNLHEIISCYKDIFPELEDFVCDMSEVLELEFIDVRVFHHNTDEIVVNVELYSQESDRFIFGLSRFYNKYNETPKTEITSVQIQCKKTGMIIFSEVYQEINQPLFESLIKRMKNVQGRVMHD